MKHIQSPEEAPVPALPWLERQPIDPERRAGREGDQPRRGPYIAWFKDPAGNILSVLQER
jgi:hypothetical protein